MPDVRVGQIRGDGNRRFVTLHSVVKFLVAETAEDFAAEIVRVYRDEDLWNLVSASGLENVRRYFSVDTARLGLQELLSSL